MTVPGTDDSLVEEARRELERRLGKLEERCRELLQN
jgi:hypothetical protein